MKQRVIMLVLIVLLAGLCVPPVFAQATGTVKGTATDLEGKPITGAVVQLFSQETGRKYELKTNNKGEYFSLGIAPGKYKFTLMKDGKEIFSLNNVPVSVGEGSPVDFNLQKEQAAGAQQKGVNPEELKKVQEQQAKVTKEKETVKTLNEKLQAANQASTAGDFDTAINVLTEASQIDGTRDLIWFRLGDAYRNSAVKQTDAAEKTKRLDLAIADYQKAIDLKQKAAETQKTPEAPKQLAAYYNNLGEAFVKAGKTDDAMKTYTQAAQVDPAGAATYYYNMGAVLTNAGKNDEAIAAFDKAIAADPNKADAYYQKGVNLIAKAKTDASGKVVPAPGTEEALNKYLELQPTGPYAEGAKGMLQYIGSTIETSYGKKKSSKK